MQLTPGQRVLVPSPDLREEVEAEYVGPSETNPEHGCIRYADGTTAEWPLMRIEPIEPAA
jgi:hypothetical protein